MTNKYFLEDNPGLEPLCYERYKLVLYHEYIDSEHKAHQIDDPIATYYSIMGMDKENMRFDSVFVINQMLDRLKSFMLNSISKEQEE